MRKERFKQHFTRLDRWLHTPTSTTTPARLRWWVASNLFDKYFSRAILLATLGSAFYLFGCNSTTTPNTTSPTEDQYVGVWENSKLKQWDVLNITREGDHFLIKKINGNRSESYPATLKDGILQLTDGSGQRYTYSESSHTLTTPGSDSQIEYRRKQ